MVDSAAACAMDRPSGENSTVSSGVDAPSGIDDAGGTPFTGAADRMERMLETLDIKIAPC